MKEDTVWEELLRAKSRIEEAGAVVKYFAEKVEDGHYSILVDLLYVRRRDGSVKDYMIMTIWEDKHPDVQLVDTLEEARAVTGYGSKPGVKYEVYHREVDDEDMTNWMMVYRQ